MPKIREEFEDLTFKIINGSQLDSDDEYEGAQSELAKDETNKLSNFEERWYEVLSSLKSIVEIHTPIQVNPNPIAPTPEVKLRLPNIEIPKFSGNYNEWLPFYDSFLNLIHNNNSLNDTQKLQYLKSSLQGDALRAVGCLTVSGNSYSAAWDQLQKRYQNSRLIVQEHINTIINAPEVVKNTPSALRKLIDDVTTSLQALKVLTIPVDSWDAIIVQIVTNKLDFQTRKDFENTLSSEVPTQKELFDFLEKKCQVAESMNLNKPKNTGAKASEAPKPTANRVAAATVADKSCYFCQKAHFINQCYNFLRLSADERYKKIIEKRLCVNCLKPGHGNTECKSSGCKKCSVKHHTLLHGYKTTAEKPEESVCHLASPCQGGQVILSTAVFHIKNSDGEKEFCRTLLDQGAQVNLITASMVRKLGLRTSKTRVRITGINKMDSEINKRVRIFLKSLHTSFEFSTMCYLVEDAITGNNPNRTFVKSKIQLPDYVAQKLADENFHLSGSVDLLIGAGNYWEIVGTEKLKLPNSRLYSVKTKAGYILGGIVGLGSSVSAPLICNVALHPKIKNDLEQLLTRFWEQEELPGLESQFSKEELQCEMHFVNTHNRDPSDGRFEVELPLKDAVVDLGDSMQEALKRFFELERKFEKNYDLKRNYTRAIQELVGLGILQEVINPDNTKNKEVFYLPHSAVYKSSDHTRKLRIVYDGSCKSSNGLSLNDNLLKGPNLQNDLFQMLVKFRLHKVALVCDIEKMFLQIKVFSKHQNLQRIFWRDSDQDAVEVYRLTRLVFGLTNSPYTAMRCIRQLADEISESNPRASEVLHNEIFMDDILTGADNLEDALNLKKNLVEILGRGCFPLSKWCSNAPEVVADSCSSEPVLIGEPTEENSAKVLGILWDPNEDNFRYRVKSINIPSKLTKRSVLSAIAKLFDPIGLISPVVVKAKILMQTLTTPIGWDDVIPDDIYKAWCQIVKHLPRLDALRVPRLITAADSVELELVSFSDASLDAFGAAVYLRTKIVDEEYSMRLICSKSRVSPSKVVSLPRLELSAALLAAELLDRVAAALNLKGCRKFFFTDSMIVLHYVNSDVNHWKVYVANRVAKIQSLSEPCQWFYVNTKENPADIISRGAFADQLIDNNLFWNGPGFLTKNKLFWPSLPTPLSNKSLDLEERRKTVMTLQVEEELPVLNRFSTYFQTQRVIALCLRFRFNCKNPKNKRLGPLTAFEMIDAHKAIIKATQKRAFLYVFRALEQNKPLPNKSNLLALDPFVDADGLMRVGGRLRHATNLNDFQKHPIVLPYNNHVSKLLIRLEHLLQLHAGPNQTLGSVRLKYWPLRARSQIRNVIHFCRSCFKVSPKMIEQKMGNLPKNRLTPCKPFTNAGLDYFGPLYIKLGTRKSTKVIKTWVALFVCLFSEAVHLEVVGDLTSETFINALKRLVARRGRVARIACDNATTFVGAKNELEKIERSLFIENELPDNVASFLANSGIVWEFIPPRSPNFGGVWERLVKSAKLHFKKVALNANLTLEEANTLITQIEACINSRSLCPVSNDPAEFDILTPGHFLVGESLFAIPEYDLTSEKLNRLNRWQRTQQIARHFWNRWSKEVITQMQPRSKWQRSNTEEIKVGDLVLVSDDNLPPLQWCTGRIENLYPGSDELVRVADVRTSRGLFKRSIRKLALVPFEKD